MRQNISTPAAPPRPDRGIERAWERFQANIPLHGDEGPRPEVLASWQRSRKHRVSPGQGRAPLDPGGLLQARLLHRELVTAAAPVLRETGDLIGGSGGIVLLCDPQGLVLEVAGAPGTLDLALDANIVPGGVWTEAACGTNAVGTALEEGRAVEFRGTEHYCHSIRHWTCAAGLVRDPRSGRLLGALDISYRCPLPALHALPLAVSVARRIEHALEQGYLRRHSFLLDRYAERVQRYIGDAVLLLDRDGALLAWNGAAPGLLAARGVDGPLARGMAFDPLLGRLGADGHESLVLAGDHAGMIVVLAAQRRAVAGSAGHSRPADDAPPTPGPRPSLRPPRLRDTERDAILAAMRAENGQRQRVAARLGISRTTLYRRLVAYGIDAGPES